MNKNGISAQKNIILGIIYVFIACSTYLATLLHSSLVLRASTTATDEIQFHVTFVFQFTGAQIDACDRESKDLPV
jgi:hypothetical protein